MELSVGGRRRCAPAFQRVAAAEDPGRLADEAEDAEPAAHGVAQHTADDLTVSDLAGSPTLAEWA